MPRNSYDNSLARFNKVDKIIKSYSSELKHLRFQNENSKGNNDFSNVKKTEKVLKALSDPYRTIIKNIFIENKEMYWWVDYYPKTTYYRMRNKAIKSFLRAYNLK